MQWITRIGLVLVVVIAGGWIFRAEIALFGINRMMAAENEIGPTQEVVWSSGGDAEGRSLEERPPNIVLILADEMRQKNPAKMACITHASSTHGHAWSTSQRRRRQQTRNTKNYDRLHAAAHRRVLWLV